MLGLALIMFLTGLAELASGGLGSADAVQSFLMAYSMGLMGLLCLPSVWFAFQRLSNPTGPAPHRQVSLWSRLFPGQPGWDSFRVVTLVSVILLPLSLAVGHLAAKSGELSWLLLPPLNLIATGLPVLWLALLGMRKLDGGSAQRQWGILTVAVAIGPVFILVAEVMLLILGGGLVMIYLSSQPGVLNELRQLLREMRNLPSPDQEALLRMLEPYLKNPGVMAGVFLMLAVFAPLIEELFKPIGVWLLAWKKLTPSQGLVGGILSGAGFALFENLGNTSGAGDQWALVALSRIPAALLHMLTSGLVGWALASAWSSGRYGKLAATFAIAVAIHGTWNGLAVIGAANIPVDQPLALSAELPTNGLVSVIGLILLAVFNFVGYLVLNRSLRAKPEAVEVDNMAEGDDAREHEPITE